MSTVKHRPSLRTEGAWSWRSPAEEAALRAGALVSSGLSAILTVLAVAMVVFISTSAKAADLGGDCCADLEERVAELEATTARKGNRKVSVTVYGQVNQAVLFFDPDVPFLDEDVTVVDNQASPSRFGFKGEAQIAPKVSAGFVLEIGLDQEGNPFDPASSYDLQIRQSYWYLSGEIGRLSVGQQSTATDDIDNLSVANLGGATKLLSIEPVGSSHLLGLALPFDGSRSNVVRYDSPSLAGFVISASWGEDDIWDVALRYAGEFGEFRVAGAVGHRESSELDLGIGALPIDTKTTLASGSLMHTTSGLFVNGMYAHLEIDGAPLDVDAWNVLAGIETKIVEVGKTTVYGEYAQVLIDTPFASLEPSWYGLGIVQAVDAAAMDFYITYRKYDTDGLGADPQQVVGGSRIRF